VQKQLQTEAGLLRVHNKLGHPSTEQLMRRLAPALPPEAVPRVRKLAECIHDKCKICQKFKKPSPHPKTSGMSARDVNDLVCLDSFEVPVGSSKYVFHHLVDSFTKFSLCEHVPGKSPSGTIATLSRWQATFGSLPRAILSDNGGEYANGEVERFLVHHGVRHFFIPPNTPA
jgi:transposase InsO family protein